MGTTSSRPPEWTDQHPTDDTTIYPLGQYSPAWDSIPYIRRQHYLVLPFSNSYGEYIKIYFFDVKPLLNYFYSLPPHERAWLDTLYSITMGTCTISYYIDNLRRYETYYHFTED